MLSARLQKIADMVLYNSLVDIGSDHALLPISLLLSGRIKRAIAADIAPLPLERGRVNAVRHGVVQSIDFKLTDGLLGLDFGYESCVIAGMGGESIMHILRDELDVAHSFKQLILSPQRDLPLVRRFLHTHGFEITDEVMLIENGKFYNILDCKVGIVEEYNETEYIFGHHLINKKCPVLAQYLKSEIEKFSRFGTDRHFEYISLCKEVLKCIK